MELSEAGFELTRIKDELSRSYSKLEAARERGEEMERELTRLEHPVEVTRLEDLVGETEKEIPAVSKKNMSPEALMNEFAFSGRVKDLEKEIEDARVELAMRSNEVKDLKNEVTLRSSEISSLKNEIALRTVSVKSQEASDPSTVPRVNPNPIDTATIARFKELEKEIQDSRFKIQDLEKELDQSRSVSGDVKREYESKLGAREREYESTLLEVKKLHSEHSVSQATAPGLPLSTPNQDFKIRELEREVISLKTELAGESSGVSRSNQDFKIRESSGVSSEVLELKEVSTKKNLMAA